MLREAAVKKLPVQTGKYKIKVNTCYSPSLANQTEQDEFTLFT